MSAMPLLPDKECGKCSACCIEFAFEYPELLKLSGVKCQNLSIISDCKIYNSRPEICSSYNCLWRSLPLLGDEWRPDRKGVLISQTSDNIPEKYSNKIALDFMIIGKKSIIYELDFIELIGGYILSGFPCFLTYTKPKHASRKAFLNDDLHFAFISKDIALIKFQLSAIFDECQNSVTEKMEIKKGKIVRIPIRNKNKK